MSKSIYSCNLCKYQGTTKQYLTRHQMIVHSEPTVKCDLCPKLFHHRCKMLQHKLVHTGEKPYVCSVCAKAFNSQYSLKTHGYIHTNSKPFTCDVCPFACRDSSTLRKHKYRHSDATNHSYKCSVCGHTLKSKKNLKLHVAEKHLKIDVNIFHCESCDKRFKLKADLALHIQRVHFRTQTGQCPICKKVLAQRQNMPIHLKTHTNDRPYKCKAEGCGKTYRDSSTLRKHTILHFPERHLRCDQCDWTFTRPQRLEEHRLRMHGPRKEHVIPRLQCDECGYISGNKPGLARHITCSHGVQHKCKVCSKTYKHKWRLRNHYSSVHGLDYKRPVKHQTIKSEPVDQQSEDSTEMKDSMCVDIKQEPIDTDDEDLNSVHLFEIEKEENPTEPPPEVSSTPKCAEDIQVAEATKRLEESELSVHISAIPGVIGTICDAAECTREPQHEIRVNVENEDIAKEIHTDNILENTNQDLPENKDLDQNSEKTVTKIKPKIVCRGNKTFVRPKIVYKKRKKGNKIKNLKNLSEESAKTLIENNITSLKKVPDAIFDQLFIQNLSKESKESSDDDSSDDPSSNDLNDNQNEENAGFNSDISDSGNYCTSQDRSVDKNGFKSNKKAKKSIGNKTKLSKRKNNNSKSKDDRTISKSVKKKYPKTHDFRNISIYTQPKPFVVELENPLSRYSTRRRRYDYKEILDNQNDDFNDYCDEVNHYDNDSTDEYKAVNDEKEKTDKIVKKKAKIKIIRAKNDKLTRKVVKKKARIHVVREKISKEKDKKKKVLSNSHQCYVCLKIYDSKENLIDHCKDHFDICNASTLKKCPLCDHVSYALPRHMNLVHNIDITNKYNAQQLKDRKDNSQGSRYYVEVDVENDVAKKIDVIPSVKNLNRIASRNIDKRNREKKDKMIGKEKLVKRKEWVVEREKLNVENVIVPKIDVEIAGEEYMEKIRKLYFIAKKEGKVMMFPCQNCDKICQTFSALKLHKRRHDPNKKPFRPKKMKLGELKARKGKLMQKDSKGKSENVGKDSNDTENGDKIETFGSFDENDPGSSEKNNAENSDKNKQESSDKNNQESDKNADINKIDIKHRNKKPKPIIHKHKCPPELKSFYENCIRGENIEFWQFLKIYNKMGRENVKDFGDLESRGDVAFGLHAPGIHGDNLSKSGDNLSKNDDSSSKSDDNLSKRGDNPAKSSNKYSKTDKLPKTSVKSFKKVLKNASSGKETENLNSHERKNEQSIKFCVNSKAIDKSNKKLVIAAPSSRRTALNVSSFKKIAKLSRKEKLNREQVREMLRKKLVLNP